MHKPELLTLHCANTPPGDAVKVQGLIHYTLQGFESAFPVS